MQITEISAMKDCAISASAKKLSAKILRNVCMLTTRKFVVDRHFIGRTVALYRSSYLLESSDECP